MTRKTPGKHNKRPAKRAKAAKRGKPAKGGKVAKGRLTPNFFELRLYVAGQSPRSLVALTNLREICEKHLPGRYRIEVIDLQKHPQLATVDQILALPTLVRRLPEPIRKLIGDLSDTERALVGLDLRPLRGAP